MRNFQSVSDLPSPENGSPGWPEVVIGLITFVAVGFGGGSQLYRLGLSSTAYGLAFAGLSGIAGLLGFLAAFLLRTRDMAAFGIRRTTFGWLVLAAGAGLVAFVAKGLVALAMAGLFHSNTNVQEVYVAGARGGPMSLVLATLLLAVLTPLGEEFLFRGVLTTALLRYGAPIAVGGSALIFAVIHGLNPILPVALLEGAFAAEIFRRSGSIWTAVTVHIVYNLPTVPVMILGEPG